MSESGLNLTTDGVYAFDFVEWQHMKLAAERLEIDAALRLFDYSDDQDLLLIMQPVGPSGDYYELGYVTPDQLRGALHLAGLLPEPVENEPDDSRAFIDPEIAL